MASVAKGQGPKKKNKEGNTSVILELVVQLFESLREVLTSGGVMLCGQPIDLPMQPNLMW